MRLATTTSIDLLKTAKVIMFKQIEIEFRSIFSKEKHNQLQAFLNENAADLGQDDKDVFFYIFPDKLLKVVNNISKKNAKLVLKLNKIGQGSSFEEIEVPFDTSDFEKLNSIFQNLGYSKSMRSFQKRHNYNYRGVEIALKYSDSWGYHAELEQVVDDMTKKKEAEDNILAAANDLGLKLMTDKELKKFTATKEKEAFSN
jgi:predicted adenylyl cyclase CyaB